MNLQHSTSVKKISMLRLFRVYAADPQYADDEITVMMNHYNLDYNGDIQDYFSDDGEIVWSSNDYLYE
jgi:hypothetical protein